MEDLREYHQFMNGPLISEDHEENNHETFQDLHFHTTKKELDPELKKEIQDFLLQTEQHRKQEEENHNEIEDQNDQIKDHNEIDILKLIEFLYDSSKNREEKEENSDLLNINQEGMKQSTNLCKCFSPLQNDIHSDEKTKFKKNIK
jgi:hypothetical protein